MKNIVRQSAVSESLKESVVGSRTRCRWRWSVKEA